MSERLSSGNDFTVTVTAMRSVRNGAGAIDFYKAAFGASEVYRIDGDDGTVVARVSVSGAEFWVADESPEHLNFSPESLGGGSARLVLTVEDPDAAYERAIGADRRSLRTPLGDREAADLPGDVSAGEQVTRDPRLPPACSTRPNQRRTRLDPKRTLPVSK